MSTGRLSNRSYSLASPIMCVYLYLCLCLCIYPCPCLCLYVLCSTPFHHLYPSQMHSHCAAEPPTPISRTRHATSAPKSSNKFQQKTLHSSTILVKSQGWTSAKISAGVVSMRKHEQDGIQNPSAVSVAAKRGLCLK